MHNIDLPTQKINRRNFVTSTAAVSTVGVCALGGQLSDPHIYWLSKWTKILKEMAEPDMPEAEREALLEDWNNLAIKLANTPAKTRRGLMAQFQWFRQDFGHYVAEMIGDDLSQCLDVIEAGIGEAV